MTRAPIHAVTDEQLDDEAREAAELAAAEADRKTFVETPAALGILGALAHAQAAGDMVCVYGAPGAGKTRTIAHYRHGYEHVWVATITPASAAVVPALEEVAEACGVHAGGGARALSRAIRNKVAGLDGLIIIDEAQHLSIAAVEELRAIHDATGVGLALVGNESVYARLTGGSRAAAYAQLFSRLGLRHWVKKPSPEDVRAIAAKWRVRDARALALLERIAARPGALRGVVKVLSLATGEGTPTYDRVRAAADVLGAEVM